MKRGILEEGIKINLTTRKDRIAVTIALEKAGKTEDVRSLSG